MALRIGHRIALTVLIVIIIMFSLAMCGYMAGRWEDVRAETAVQDVYLEVPFDTKLLQLDKQALDEAYHATLIRLWTIWLQEGAKDPKYFKTGLANARRAYGMAAKQITERESKSGPR